MAVSSTVPTIANVLPNDWNSVLRFSRDVQKYLNSLAKSDQVGLYSTLTLSDLTASRLVATDSSKTLESTDLNSWVTGTANEINITDDGDGTITIGIVDPLIVAKGGTGAATLTDHGLLVGSGTLAITALGVATDGQLPIGSTGADPVLAALTGTANQISVTNGAGSITLALTGNMDELSALAVTDGNFIVGNGSTWVAESGDTARTSLGVGTGDSPTLTGLTLSSLTASRLVATDGSKALISSDLVNWVAGTANQITVTDDSDGTITLSTPQDIATTSDVDFGGIQVNGTSQFGDGGSTNYSEFESDGTLEFNGNATVWNDSNVGGLALGGPAANLPDEVTFTDENGADTGIYTYGFAVGEKVSGAIEIPHSYKEGSDISFHVHWQGNDAPTGTDKVQWQLDYTVSQNGTTLDAATTITIETDIDTQYKEYTSAFASITGTNFNMGDQFLFTLERIAASADEYGGDAVLMTCGLHCEEDTVGSRQITTK